MIQIAIICGVSFEWLATGRGPKWPNGEASETPALQLNYYAHDELEERLLLALRKMPYSTRIPLVAFIEAMSALPGDKDRERYRGADDDNPLAL